MDKILEKLMEPGFILEMFGIFLYWFLFVYFTAKGIARHDLFYILAGVFEFFLLLSNILMRKNIRRKRNGHN